MPRLFGHDHFNEDVAGIHAAFGLDLAAVAGFLDLFNRQEHFAEKILEFGAADAFNDRALHALFHRGVDVNRIPAHLLRARFLSGFGTHFILRANVYAHIGNPEPQVRALSAKKRFVRIRSSTAGARRTDPIR